MAKFSIIGCGLIGKKRSLAIEALGHQVSGLYDIHSESAQSLKQILKSDVTVADSAERAIQTSDYVVVATANNALAENASTAMRLGRHVLIEKPCGRNPEELMALLELQQQVGTDLKIRAGFNHRFHPAIRKAIEIARSGQIGPIMFMRARYGHGARVGYDREWRAKKEVAGGGEWLDQGSHLIDLSRCFAGDFEHAIAYSDNFFWDMEVDDNTFAILKTSSGIVSHLHASCTEWKNMFSLEVYGKIGKLDLNGLGGSYGPETLTHYKMKPEMGPPDREVFEFSGADESWQLEIDHWLEGSSEGANLDDALKCCESVFQCYEWSRKNNPAKYDVRAQVQYR